MRCAVIADDLTGAADTAVEFAKRGHPATVLLAWEGGDLGRASVVAADTESRHLPAEEAYARAFSACRALSTAGFSCLYKKMDSTLRGNLGAEIDAVLDAAGLDLAVVAPAFPANSRTTVDGHQRYGGVRLEETSFAGDPRSPVHDSCIPRIIARQSRRQTDVVGLSTVRAGEDELVGTLLKLHGRGASILIADAETTSDLTAIASALDRLPVSVLAAGSAGLAEFFARRLPLRSATTRTRLARVQAVRPGSVLVVAGSAHRVTAMQIERLARATDALVVDVPVEGEAHGVAWPRSRSIVLRLCGAVRSPEPDTGRRLAARLASLAREALESQAVGGLVLVGGDTAIAVLASLGAQGLVVERQVEPGVPCGRLTGGRYDEMPVVTKAGGFGDESTLTAAVAHLLDERGAQASWQTRPGP